jgi:hypothetical protein
VGSARFWSAPVPWRFLPARNPTPRSRRIAAWNLTLSGKAAEGYRTPRRVAFYEAQGVRQVLECASPLALFWIVDPPLAPAPSDREV